jgi:hypothetical protein
VVTAAVIVGEKLTVMTTSRINIASFVVPAASGAMGSQDQATHAARPRPSIVMVSVAAVSRPIVRS